MRILLSPSLLIGFTILSSAYSHVILPRTEHNLTTPGRRTFLENVEQAIWITHHGQQFRNFWPFYVRATPPSPDVGGIDVAGPSSNTNEPSSCDPEAFTAIQVIVGRNDIFGRPQKIQIESDPEIWGRWHHARYVRRSEGNDYPKFRWSTLNGFWLLRRKAMDLVDAANLARDSSAAENLGPWRMVEVFFNKDASKSVGGPQIIYRFTAGMSEGNPGVKGHKGVDVMVKTRKSLIWER